MATDKNRNVTAYEYNEMNRISWITDPNGNSTAFEYDLIWNIAKETDRNDNYTTYKYDLMNRLVSSADANGNTTYYHCDAAGEEQVTFDSYDSFHLMILSILLQVPEMTNMLS